ncbi:MAG: DedA family protein, partial [Mycobacteriales bacterium]
MLVALHVVALHLVALHLVALHVVARHLAGAAVYVTVLTLVFVESGLLIGFFLPGDTVLFGAGLVAHRPSAQVNLAVLVVGVVVAAVAGDAVGYLLGRRLGRPALTRRYPAQVLRTDRFAARFGPFAVVAARFIPWVRTFTPVL